MKIYAIQTLPLHWIVKHNNKFWIVPAINNGWSKKAPYKGHTLKQSDECGDYLAIGLGIPEESEATVTPNGLVFNL
jgi:hypothetical protein